MEFHWRSNDVETLVLTLNEIRAVGFNKSSITTIKFTTFITDVFINCHFYINHVANMVHIFLVIGSTRIYV